MSYPTHIFVIQTQEKTKQIEVEYRANPSETDVYVVSLAKDLYGSSLKEIHKVKNVTVDTVNLAII